MKETNLLLTGPPGIGKTTAVERIAEKLREGVNVGGFVTRELREEGSRVGFRLVAFDGREETLAHIDYPPPQISTYGVDLEALESVVDETLDLTTEVDVFVVDEIGKMEVMSDRFIESMERLLDDERPVVATVGTSDRGLMGEVQTRDDVELWHLTEQNRDDIPDRAIEWLAGL